MGWEGRPAAFLRCDRRGEVDDAVLRFSEFLGSMDVKAVVLGQKPVSILMKILIETLDSLFQGRREETGQNKERRSGD